MSKDLFNYLACVYKTTETFRPVRRTTDGAADAQATDEDMEKDWTFKFATDNSHQVAALTTKDDFMRQLIMLLPSNGPHRGAIRGVTCGLNEIEIRGLRGPGGRQF